MVRKLTLLLCFVVALVNSGACATIGHGTRQEIFVTSEPRGALVFVGDTAFGPTPTVAKVPRRSKLTIRFELDGFEPLKLPVKRSGSALLAADAALAVNPASCQGLSSAKGCPGLLVANLAWFFGIDFLTGAAFKFPNSVNGVLIKR